MYGELVTRLSRSVALQGQAVYDYEKANQPEHQKNAFTTQRQVLWTKPEAGWIKVNVDAALNKKEGVMGFGLVMRDQEGTFLAAKCIRKRGLWESVVAEALALYHETVFGREKGVQHIVIKGDAKQITYAIHEKGLNTSMVGHLIGDVKLNLNIFPRWQVNHVHREGNRVAHGLARMALQQVNDTVWSKECPSCIRDIILTEQLLYQ
ncbi:uncharacterized protein LOC132191757 [Corylus avellana]|uniref:uncharacterized protein LOC132191757 n=1 Tax=Corylus avellana TaxID=13451 RepID=UPI00286C886F|nr:uncharacterized protein LOC132191757 [Corylus avellana]